MSNGEMVIVGVAALICVFGLWAGLAWIVLCVAAGFGAALPFWPTFGCVALVTLFTPMRR